MCACMCAVLLLLPRVLFFVHGRESESCMCCTDGETNREREVVVLLVCANTTRRWREKRYLKRE